MTMFPSTHAVPLALLLLAASIQVQNISAQSASTYGELAALQRTLAQKREQANPNKPATLDFSSEVKKQQQPATTNNHAVTIEANGEVTFNAKNNNTSASASEKKIVDIDKPRLKKIVDKKTKISPERKPSCEPKPFLNGKFDACDTFRIATMNSSPARQCIHIEIPPTPPQSFLTVNGSKKPKCLDFKGWHDGTNGCEAYGANPFWCVTYGDLGFDSTDWSPNQACCACGGGNPANPRLSVGEYVTLTFDEDVKSNDGSALPLKDCPRGSLRIASHTADPQFRYSVEMTEACAWHQPGAHLSVASDDPKVIDRYYKVELKECEIGAEEQEFEITPTKKNGSNDSGSTSEMITIRHKATGIDLSKVLEGVKVPFFDIEQAKGRGKAVFIKAMTSDKKGKMIDGKPSGLRH